MQNYRYAILPKPLTIFFCLFVFFPPQIVYAKRCLPTCCDSQKIKTHKRLKRTGEDWRWGTSPPSPVLFKFMYFDLLKVVATLKPWRSRKKSIFSLFFAGFLLLLLLFFVFFVVVVFSLPFFRFVFVVVFFGFFSSFFPRFFFFLVSIQRPDWNTMVYIFSHKQPSPG